MWEKRNITLHGDNNGKQVQRPQMSQDKVELLYKRAAVLNINAHTDLKEVFGTRKETKAKVMKKKLAG